MQRSRRSSAPSPRPTRFCTSWTGARATSTSRTKRSSATGGHFETGCRTSASWRWALGLSGRPMSGGWRRRATRIGDGSSDCERCSAPVSAVKSFTKCAVGGTSGATACHGRSGTPKGHTAKTQTPVHSNQPRPGPTKSWVGGATGGAMVARMAARHWRSQAIRRRNREPGAAIRPASTKPDRRKRAPAAAALSPAKFCGDLFHRRVALCDGAVDFHCRRLGRGVENPGCVVRYAAGGVPAPRSSPTRSIPRSGRPKAIWKAMKKAPRPGASRLRRRWRFFRARREPVEWIGCEGFFRAKQTEAPSIPSQANAPTRQRALPWDSPSGRRRLLRPCCRRRQAGRPRVRRA